VTGASAVAATEPRNLLECFSETLGNRTFFSFRVFFVEDRRNRCMRKKIINMPVDLLVVPEMTLYPLPQSTEGGSDIDITAFPKRNNPVFPNVDSHISRKVHHQEIGSVHSLQWPYVLISLILFPPLMTKHNPRFVKVSSLADAEKEIQKIGSDEKSIGIMAPKAVLKVIKVKNVVLQDAIIIKQDMLSLGGEVAIPKDAFELKERQADILVIGAIKQLTELVDKLRRHYPRIQGIASELAVLLKDVL
jgi:hypothetical protein